MALSLKKKKKICGFHLDRLDVVQDGGLRILKLNRPKKFNAFNKENHDLHFISEKIAILFTVIYFKMEL